jgi:hypothetical protein
MSEGAVSQATHVYIGTMPCGCNVAAAVDDPECRREVAKCIADMIRSGLAVSRVALDDLRNGTVTIRSCRCQLAHDLPGLA